MQPVAQLQAFQARSPVGLEGATGIDDVLARRPIAKPVRNARRKPFPPTVASRTARVYRFTAAASPHIEGDATCKAYRTMSF